MRNVSVSFRTSSEGKVILRDKWVYCRANEQKARKHHTNIVESYGLLRSNKCSSVTFQFTRHSRESTKYVHVNNCQQDGGKRGVSVKINQPVHVCLLGHIRRRRNARHVTIR